MKPSHKKIYVSLAFGIVAFSVFRVPLPTTVVEAAPNPLPSSYTLLEPLPCIPGGGVVCTEDLKKTVNFKEYVQYMFNLLIGLAAVSAVFMIVLGGFQYMTTDSVYGKNDGLKKAKNAILGLLLVLCSFLILQTIDPRLVQISETFVPPLFDCAGKDKENAFCKRSNVYGLFSDLEADARRYGADTRDAIARRQAYEQEVEKVDEQLAEVDREEAALGPDSGMTEIELMGEQARLSLERERLKRERERQESMAVATEYEAIFKNTLELFAMNGEIKKPSGFWARATGARSRAINEYLSWVNMYRADLNEQHAKAHDRLQAIKEPVIQEAEAKLAAAYAEVLAVFDAREREVRE